MGSGRASVNDKEGDTTTVLNVGKYENNKSTVALSTKIMKINHLVQKQQQKHWHYSLDFFTKAMTIIF